MSSELLKVQIIEAGRKAVEQLIKVAKENIIKQDQINLNQHLSELEVNMNSVILLKGLF